jgi:hypothetical protein
MHTETKLCRQPATPGGWAAYCEYARKEASERDIQNRTERQEGKEQDVQLNRS